MALIRSKSMEFFPQSSVSSNTRQLQEALYTHLDDLEKAAFIEVLNMYGSQRDIFELVNSLRKILNTPVKRQLFPLVRRVIRPDHLEAFDLITRGDKQNNSTRPPYLYRPHVADLNVLNKYRTSTLPLKQRNVVTATRQWVEREATNHEVDSALAFSRLEKFHKLGGASGQDPKHKPLPNPSSSPRQDADLIEIDLGEPESGSNGYGFTIRGGLDIGVGVYVSSIVSGSLAQKKGLMVGDLILEVNSISFRSISHEEAARIIKACTRLRVTVSRVGRVPKSRTVHEAYSWTDPKGRPVSPPAEGSGSSSWEDDGRRRSATQMLKGSDERKINIVVQKGHGLGIMIRGGKEYGLGIFVSGIDAFSLAQNAGIKLGDQILDVNGHSFLDVTHSEAVGLLKMSRHLILTVKDVGKIPFAKTTIDERGWIESTRVDSYSNSLSLSSRKSVSGSVTDQDMKQKSFLRGAGTQLMLSSSLGKAKQREQIHDLAKLLLNEAEHAALNYYLAEYEKKAINVMGLVSALLELFNTPAKFTILSEIRATLSHADLHVFDKLVVRSELEKSLNIKSDQAMPQCPKVEPYCASYSEGTNKLTSQARTMLAPDAISMTSYDSDDVINPEMHKQTMFSHPKHEAQTPQWMTSLDFDQDDQLFASEQLESSHRLTRSTPDISNRILDPSFKLNSRSRSRPRSPRSVYRILASQNVLKNKDPSSQMFYLEDHALKGKVDDPSDDSGVDINGHAQSGTTTESRASLLEHKPTHSLGLNPLELSEPQKKILSHLQQRTRSGGRADNNKTLHNVHAENKDALGSDHFSYLPYPDSPRSDKGSYHFPEHETKEIQLLSEDDEAEDIVALEADQATDSRTEATELSQLSLSAESRRSRHRTRHDGMFRPRSQSKHKKDGGVHKTTSRDSKKEEKQSSKALLAPRELKLSGKDSQAHHSQVNIEVTKKQRPTSLSGLLSKYRSRRDKSSPEGISSRSPEVLTSPRTAHSGKSLTTLTVNGHVVPSTELPSSKSSSSHRIQQIEAEIHHHKLSNPVSLDSHAKIAPTSNQNDTNVIHGTSNGSDTTNTKSKRSLYSTARKNSSNEATPTKVGGITSGRYKSPRRDKYSTKINVPLIKISQESQENIIASSSKQGENGRESSDVIGGNNYLTVNQNRNVLPGEQKSSARLMPEDRVNGRDRAHSRGSDVGLGKNVTSISVGDPSGQDHPEYSIDFIKKKAAEKYGEIPLEVVYIYRSKPTLGVAIEGGANTRQPFPKVISVQPGGSAFESGGLKVGHVILEVNDKPVVGLSHMDAARLIAEAFKNRNTDRMELLVTEWSDQLLDTIKVDIGLLKVK